jgi:hypothetical protein
MRHFRTNSMTLCCHSYGFNGASADEAGQNGSNLINQFLERYVSKGERAANTISDISEILIRGCALGDGHGMFTYFMLKGLKQFRNCCRQKASGFFIKKKSPFTTLKEATSIPKLL